MIENVNQILSAVAGSELGRAARRSARTIFNAHRSAIRTTRRETGKVIGLARMQGRKLAAAEAAKLSRRVDELSFRVQFTKTRRPARRAA